MKKEFRFNLPDQRSGAFKKLSAFLFFVNAAAFILNGIYKTVMGLQIACYAVAFLVAIGAFLDWRYQGKKIYITVYLVAAAAWIMLTPFWYFAVMNIVLCFLHALLEKQKYILFTPESIIARGSSQRSWDWDQVSHIILKEGLLTIDFRDNRIIQVEPEPVIDNNKDYASWERDFNDFCRSQLSA